MKVNGVEVASDFYIKFIEDNFSILDKDTQQPVPYRLNSIQKEYARFLIDEYTDMEGIREIVLKARQQGMSSFILALFTVDFICVPFSKSLCISHSKDSSERLFKKVKFYIESYCQKNGLPAKNYLETETKGLISSKVNKAEFYIATAGSAVGVRGDSARNILFSEAAFYQDTDIITAEETVVGSSQQVPLGFGKLFIESTANGIGNFYQREWERSERGESMWKPRFFAANKFYSPEWLEQKRRELPNEKKFRQEYPNTPDEAFISTGEPFFDNQLLKAMLDSNQKPIAAGRLSPSGEWANSESEHSSLRVYRDIEPNEQLVVFGDPADSQDYCAAVAISKKYYDCPIIFNEVMESSQFGYELNAMCKYIFNKTNIWPKLAVERNTGQATIYVLKLLNYPDLFRMIDFSATSNTESGSIGWQTTGHLSGGELQGTRRKMLDDLALSIKQGMVKISDDQQLRQMMSFMIVKGRAQAKANKKDDLVMACLTEDTEVLTETGWQLITDVEVGERVPSLNLATNKVELATNTETVNNPYRGKMIHFKGRSSDFLVTPNHRMVVHKSRGGNQYTGALIERADALLGKHFRLHKDGQWGGTEKEKWTIPAYTPNESHAQRNRVVFDTNDFLSLLGLYISEGSGVNEKFIISQTPKGNTNKMIPELLTKMGISYTLYENDFTVNSPQLARYIKSLIHGIAHEKRIPREILNLHPQHLKFLYEGLMAGDGSATGRYTTSSHGLRDDFLELINRLGWSATWNAIPERLGGGVGNRQVGMCREYFVISIIKNHLRPRLNHHNKTDITEVDYEGRQVCLSLDRNNVMLVRRNRTMMWTGNTAGAWQVQMVTPSVEWGDYDEDASAKRREKWRFK